jgi:uncharacterized protein GlcG (DUF336 family)
MRTNSKWIVLAAIVSSVCAANAQTLVSERSVSTNAALEMATAALEACRKHGSLVTITVLDHADRTVVSVRKDGASPHSVEHTLRKAYTALTYDMSSGEYGKRVAKNPAGSAGPLHLANMTTAPGGLPIRAGSALVGAIGASGTPGEKGGGGPDEACAQTGIDRIAMGLSGN